jgi:hypothetical protein
MREEAGPPVYHPPGALLRSVFAALIVATALAAAGMLLSRVNGGEAQNFDPRCEHLDVAAVMRLAELISDRDEAVQMQVRQGLMRLRRARRNCLYGAFAIALHDYEAISIVGWDRKANVAAPHIP